MAQTACRFKVKKYLFFFLPSNILGLVCRIEVINILIILPSIKTSLNILGLLYRFEEINMSIILPSKTKLLKIYWVFWAESRPRMLMNIRQGGF